eukprot:99433_1
MATTGAYTEEEIQPLSRDTTASEDAKSQESVDNTDKPPTYQEKSKDPNIVIDMYNPNDLGDMTLIDRAHSDPLAMTSNYSAKQHNLAGENSTDASTTQAKRDSILLANRRSSVKKYHSHDDILNTKKLGDFGGFSIREMSVEVLAIKTDGRQEKKEEIVVPARDNLVKMPFFTTPLTVEATHHAFFDFRERLVEMGFDNEAEAALVHTQCESVEEAISFIFDHEYAIYHRFMLETVAPTLQSIDEEADTDVSGDTLCAQCQCALNQHLIDQHGKKVQTGEDESRDVSFDMAAVQSVFAAMETKEEENADPVLRIHSIEEINEMIEKAESQLAPAPTYDGPTEECLICFEPKPADYFTKTECGHDHYCKECLTAHYKVKTTDGDVLKVKCIDPKCEREIGEDEILIFLTDDEVREKFRKFKRQKLLMLNENARFCPTVDCDGYMIGSRISPKLVCPECSTTICFNCSRLWHGYFTKCTSAQVAAPVDENDEKFHQWELNKRDNVKKCPKCKMRIEKDAGCNHMTCVSCKYEFCWLCKGKYTSRHYSAWNIFGCPGAQFGQPRSKMKMCCRSLVIILLMILLSPIILVLCILYALITILAHCLVCWLDICCCRW